MAHILVVDDERSIRLTVREFLQRDGHTVTACEDAEQALATIEKTHFDVVITDIIMPRTSGIALLEKIRTLSPSTQVIIMTGEPTVDTAVQAVRSGAHDYLSKPIRKNDLLYAVTQAARIKALIDERNSLEQENLNYQHTLEERVKLRTEAVEAAMEDMIRLLSNVVELRDPYTAGHQRRVGNLAAALAADLGLAPETQDLLRIIGYIHDIGKIVIPAEILSKPGTLSRGEWEIIQVHPAQGYDMLQKVSLPPIIAQTVYQHHERLDGSGYPRGLKDEAITQETRIMVVADVVESMISHRPYRPALGISAALDEISQGSGSQYDAAVVQACIDVLERDPDLLDNNEMEIRFPL